RVALNLGEDANALAGGAGERFAAPRFEEVYVFTDTGADGPERPFLVGERLAIRADGRGGLRIAAGRTDQAAIDSHLLQEREEDVGPLEAGARAALQGVGRRDGGNDQAAAGPRFEDELPARPGKRQSGLFRRRQGGRVERLGRVAEVEAIGEVN